MKDKLKEFLKIKDKTFIRDVLTFFIREEFHKVGFKKAVVGISGGVDSALSAFLGVMALGKENIIGISMPYRTSSNSSIEDARLVANTLGIEFHEIDITPQVDSYYEMFPDADNVRRGNKMARERMSILYDFAHWKGALVLGTSNKSELLIGYSTRWGDGVHDINPLGDLYKTQVWELAEFVGVPERIVKKKPSADLWPGQTDEGEIGLSYHLLDQILAGYVDLRLGEKELIEAGYEKKVVKRVLKLVQNSQYKRRLPIICKISQRTVDKDFLYLRDWGL
ncbi:NH(3)-dependent NAD(+) synthetase [Desulfurobacterium thermolithotrophum DSM 11699]|uniref:NH(3)-dependent NAD(+) synthetase n=1 Tax=Desulfurobacterium thermolithotrophum (strain DSM 11699 / BSA) TaxID=868864 RepID=F0S392_DESTD|nr:NAD+ synthase [Desulfurobacterium thermolithotrophum]ADY73314.1 NH(3)-dependent NAD(+) synthetase [Desulfurobacterium thermolithotrophum DSM 11699]